MGMMIYEFWTVMETIKTVSVVSKRDLGMAENAMSYTQRLELAVCH